MELNVAIILLMLVLSAFFSGSEMAFISSNKLMVEINRRKSPRSSKIIDLFMADSSTLIATILVGNNVALVVYGLKFNEVFTPYIQGVVGHSEVALLLAQTVLSTIVIIITAEFLPKTVMQHNPSSMLSLLAMPLMLFYVIFYPVAKFMQLCARLFITYVLRQKNIDDVGSLLPSRIDLDDLLSKQAAKANPADKEVAREAKLMKNALDFGQAKVRDCLVPRTEIEAVEVGDPASELRQKFIKSGYSKIMVYQGTIDNIIGYVHVSGFFKGFKTIKQMMQPVLIVPETMDAKVLLRRFMAERKSIALVVDELGGTAGMITTEDVLEEIFGEINDEHDTEELEEKQTGEHEFIFSGRLEIDYINEKYKLGLDSSDEYDTLAGLILHNHHSIPRPDDVIEAGGFEFKILTATHARIDKVKVAKKA